MIKNFLIIIFALFLFGGVSCIATPVQTHYEMIHAIVTIAIDSYISYLFCSTVVNQVGMGLLWSPAVMLATPVVDSAMRQWLKGPGTKSYSQMLVNLERSCNFMPASERDIQNIYKELNRLTIQQKW